MHKMKLITGILLLSLSTHAVAECVAAGKVKRVLTQFEDFEIYEYVRIITPAKHLVDFVHSSQAFSVIFHAAYAADKGLTVGGQGGSYSGQCVYAGNIGNVVLKDGGYVSWISQGRP
jgi:hypothetical protein